jgi:hypothetical protein
VSMMLRGEVEGEHDGKGSGRGRGGCFSVMKDSLKRFEYSNMRNDC